MSALAVAVALAVAAVLPARASSPSFDRYVDLQLVVAVDISGSMDYYEQQVQRDGYVAAFRDPEVIKAITSGPYGRIAVTYVRWAGGFIQEAAVPWRIVGSQADAHEFAEAIRNAPLYTERGTSISSALNFSLSAFSVSGVDSDRRTIDISGDGANNDGPPVAPVRERILGQGITINGLPILLNPSGVPGNFVGLDAYYQDCVVGGPGSFSIPVRKIEEFAPAIRRKLILEIAAVPPRELDIAIEPVSSILPVPRVNCAAADRSTIFNFFP
jgi:hypothetical protein